MNFLNEYLQNQNCVTCLTDSFSHAIFPLTLLLGDKNDVVYA